MAERVVIYHNPRCSKSRQALALLRERGIEPDVVLYLKSPPSATAIRRLLRRLEGPPHASVRRNERSYREAGLSESSTRMEIAEAIARHPVLLQRPVVVLGDRAVVARPPERVLELIAR